MADDYRYLQSNIKEIEVENEETVKNRPISVNVDHEFGPVAGPSGRRWKY